MGAPAHYPIDRHRHLSRTWGRHRNAAEARRHGDVRVQAPWPQCLYRLHEQMGLRVRERLEMEHELRDALRREAFRLVYQPIVDMQSGKIWRSRPWCVGSCRTEACVLHQRSFRPLKIGLIIQLGNGYCVTACLQLKQWVSSGLDLRCRESVHHQFQDLHLLEKVTIVLRETGWRLRVSSWKSRRARPCSIRRELEILGKLSALGVRIGLTIRHGLFLLELSQAHSGKHHQDRQNVCGRTRTEAGCNHCACRDCAAGPSKRKRSPRGSKPKTSSTDQGNGMRFSPGLLGQSAIEADAMSSVLSRNTQLVAVSNRILARPSPDTRARKSAD